MTSENHQQVGPNTLGNDVVVNVHSESQQSLEHSNSHSFSRSSSIRSITNIVPINRIRPLVSNRQSRTIRWNVASLIADNWSQITTASKIYLAVSSILHLAQIAGGIALLAVSFVDNCAELKGFTVAYVVKSMVAVPIVWYVHLHPVARERLDPYQVRNLNGLGEVETRTSSTRFAMHIQSLKSMVDFAATMLFVLANYWVIAQPVCRAESPNLYLGTAIWMVINYAVILFPLFLCCAVIFCLPVVLVSLRLVHLGDDPVRTMGTWIGGPLPRRPRQGLTKKEKEKLKVVRFTSNLSNELFSNPTFNASNVSNPNKEGLNEYPGFTVPNQDDALCVICLSSYEEGELLRLLDCGHHFHLDCANEWHSVSRTCPLCVKECTKTDQQEEAMGNRSSVTV
ncbi:hypothetical protein BKA69DRAFT_1055281 [Paraphysoderma sedebokerense]|nr:hypothetical protein BKA69DRAFT_1055281 [Paraphysoderma sedebokerense]